jgi:hypothetical protein
VICRRALQHPRLRYPLLARQVAHRLLTVAPRDRPPGEVTLQRGPTSPFPQHSLPILLYQRPLTRTGVITRQYGVTFQLKVRVTGAAEATGMSKAVILNLGYANISYGKNGVFWDCTPCGSCKKRRFGGTRRLDHQGDKNR